MKELTLTSTNTHEITTVAEYLEEIQNIVESNSKLKIFFRGQTQLGSKVNGELITCHRFLETTEFHLKKSTILI